MECRELKPYRGFDIEKSYSRNGKGKIIKGSIVYTAYDSEDGGLYDGAKTLPEIKKKIDIYLSLKK